MPVRRSAARQVTEDAKAGGCWKGLSAMAETPKAQGGGANVRSRDPSLIKPPARKEKGSVGDAAPGCGKRVGWGMEAEENADFAHGLRARIPTDQKKSG